jgi:predicted nucleotide-binding protein
MKVFISHASEDKESAARPLGEALVQLGYQVWYDEYVLNVGDSLSEEIDRGLAECDFGVVILSPSFFQKNWPRRELSGLVWSSPGVPPFWWTVEG